MNPRIAIKLREAMHAYKRRTGERMTYQILAEDIKALGIEAEITYSNAASQPWLYKQIRFTCFGQKAFLLRTVELEHMKVHGERVTYAVNYKKGEWQPKSRQI